MARLLGSSVKQLLMVSFYIYSESILVESYTICDTNDYANLKNSGPMLFRTVSSMQAINPSHYPLSPINLCTGLGYAAVCGHLTHCRPMSTLVDKIT